ncbi:ParA family protein [Chamaesiphon sp.]|uniref:ParA family protein n=1 Tax=Chamaesiphon sp. TaxID=2814140 RepID=UPI00359323D2
MGLVIATVNMKGGVGKTTLTVNLAACLAKLHGKRVLVVDLDTQISATLSLVTPQDFAKIRREKKTISYSIAKVLKPNARYKFDTKDLITPDVCWVKGLDLLAGDIDIYDEFLVSEKLHQETIDNPNTDFIDVWNGFEGSLIKDILAPVINDYDFIILDCAPGYNLLTRSGIMASHFYIMPARPEPLSLVGMQLLERRINKLRETHEDDKNCLESSLLGIVFILSGSTLFARYYDRVMERVTQDFDASRIFQTRIPMDVNVAKASDSFQPVAIENPSSAGSKAFVKLSQELLNKVQQLVGE